MTLPNLIQLRAGLAIDFYSFVIHTRRWGKGRSRAAARRRKIRAERARPRMITAINYETRTITIR